MKHLKTLVLMQLRDKLDLSQLKNKKQVLRNVILFLVKFTVLTIIINTILGLCLQFGLFYHSESVQIMILILTISLFLSFVSSTVELMKNLYFSEDNRVLITLPVNSNKIFLSKLVVFYVYEIKKSFNFLIPIILSCVMLLVSKNLCSPFIYFWMWIPVLIIIAIPVLLGSLFSIPTMYIYRLIKKNTIIEFITWVIFLALIITGIVYLINLIPENIDLINQWPTISKHIRSFLLAVEERLYLMSELVHIIIGEKQPNLTYLIGLETLVKLVILFTVCLFILVLVYFISRPIFFSMMAKNFEINKKSDIKCDNKKHSKYVTFIFKELRINLRTSEISVNYLMIYIIVPILILFLNAMYKAMNTKELGDMLIYTFNILLICLPLLASNAFIATYYSREGRAGYIKKTKPIHIIYPILTKLFFNVLFSIPTVFVTIGIFSQSVKFNIGDTIILGFAILFLHIGHMFYSAMLDVMNPLNEQYATIGTTVDNPNENKSTALAFILSFLYAIVAYKLLSEASLYNNDLTVGFVKLLFISVLFFTSVLTLFLKRIKAYYYEIQG